MVNNPFEDEPVVVDALQSVVYEDAEFSTEEAEILATWLSNEAFALFARYLDSVRQTSVDLMDAGAVTMRDAEEMVRHSALRQLIWKVKRMRVDLTNQLEQIAQSKNDVE